MVKMTDQQYLSDDGMRQAVMAVLKSDEMIAKLDLRVGVLKGVVHLGGSAPSYTMWKLAENLSLLVPGIRGVVNRIEAPGAPNPAREINLDFGNEK